jgi:DNA polymerase III subunit gamma/tau
MAYEPLHHKYRPQTFAELVGQEAIATTLTSALRQRRIAPAYLFTGARGTGKTSSARILAKSLNCLKSDVPTEQPCGVCDACQEITNGLPPGVYEIDAASNTGVDNIRELIGSAAIGTMRRYKVYLIDEVHMLSTSAFNALLKTLEEPPDRVVFVLATTDPQRVLPTIISRCQRFDFRRIPLEPMVTHLSNIAQREAIAIAPEAVQLVAQLSQGGLRDAESLLDQLSLLEGEITLDRVWELVGAVPERDLLTLIQAIASSDATTVIDQARYLMDRGREPLTVLQNLASFYRDLLIAKTSPDRPDLVAITPSTWQDLCQFAQTLDIRTILLGQQRLRQSEVQVKNSTQPRLWLEVTLMELLPSAIGLDAIGLDTIGLKPVEAARPAQAQPSQTVQPSNGRVIQPNPVQPQPVQPLPTEAIAPTVIPAEPQPIEAIAPPDPLPIEIPLEAELLPLPELESSQPEEPNSVERSAQETAAALQQTWDQILSQLQRLTHALFLQQGCLLAFDGVQARVGISSQPLFGMAKQQLHSVEAAFERLYGRKVRVSVEVTHLPPSGASSASVKPAPASPAPADPTAQPDRPTLKSPTVKEPESPPAPRTRSEDSDRPTYATSPEPASPAPSNSTPSKPAPSNLTMSETADLEDDPVSKAAKSLAQMFNGQIVDMEDEVAIEAIPPALTAAPPELSDTELDSDDLDDNVPF